jgi:hypothetical protein
MPYLCHAATIGRKSTKHKTHGLPSRPCTGAPIVRVCPGQASTNKDRGLMGQKCGRPPEYFNEIASGWLLGAKTRRQRVLARDTN